MYEVRNVAPKKKMMCISFNLPRSVSLDPTAPPPMSPSTPTAHVHSDDDADGEDSAFQAKRPCK